VQLRRDRHVAPFSGELEYTEERREPQGNQGQSGRVQEEILRREII